MRCREVRRLIHLQATKQSVEQVDALTQHVGSCAACGRLASEIRWADQVLANVVVPAGADDFLPRLIMAVAAETKNVAQEDSAFQPRLQWTPGLFRRVAPVLCSLLAGVAIGAIFLPRTRVVVRTVPVERERVVRVDVPLVRERVVTRFVHTQRNSSREHRTAQPLVSHGSKRLMESASARRGATPRTFPVRVLSTEYYAVEAMPPPSFEIGGGSDGADAGMLICPVRYEKMTPVPRS